MRCEVRLFFHASFSRLSFSLPLSANITVIVFDTFAGVVIGKERHTISYIFNEPTRFYCVDGNILSGKYPCRLIQSPRLLRLRSR